MKYESSETIVWVIYDLHVYSFIAIIKQQREKLVPIIIIVILKTWCHNFVSAIILNFFQQKTTTILALLSFASLMTSLVSNIAYHSSKLSKVSFVLCC